MRRLPVFLSVAMILLLGVMALRAQPAAIAQEATPAEEEMSFAGVTFDPISYAIVPEMPSPAELVAARFTIDPGAALPLEESDPQGGMLLVESGTFTVRVEGTWSLSRSGHFASSIATAEAGGAFAPPSEDIAPGTEVTLEAGDGAYIPGGVAGEIRNDGDAPAVALAFLVGPLQPMGAEATPAP